MEHNLKISSTNLLNFCWTAVQNRPSEQQKSHAMGMKKREMHENKIYTFDSKHILIIR